VLPEKWVYPPQFPKSLTKKLFSYIAKRYTKTTMVRIISVEIRDMAKRFTFQSKTKNENAAHIAVLEATQDDGRINLQFKPIVIVRGAEVTNTNEYFSNISIDTPALIKPLSKSHYKPSSRVSPSPDPDENKNRIELIIIKSKSEVEVQPEQVFTLVTPDSVLNLVPLPTEHNKEITNEQALAGEESCCNNCVIS